MSIFYKRDTSDPIAEFEQHYGFKPIPPLKKLPDPTNCQISVNSTTGEVQYVKGGCEILTFAGGVDRSKFCHSFGEGRQSKRLIHFDKTTIIMPTEYWTSFNIGKEHFRCFLSPLPCSIKLNNDPRIIEGLAILAMSPNTIRYYTESLNYDSMHFPAAITQGLLIRKTIGFYAAGFEHYDSGGFRRSMRELVEIKNKNRPPVDLLKDEELHLSDEDFEQINPLVEKVGTMKVDKDLAGPKPRGDKTVESASTTSNLIGQEPDDKGEKAKRTRFTLVKRMRDDSSVEVETIGDESITTYDPNHMVINENKRARVAVGDDGRHYSIVEVLKPDGNTARAKIIQPLTYFEILEKVKKGEFKEQVNVVPNEQRMVRGGMHRSRVERRTYRMDVDEI